MFLKSLTLKGFKSFADSTALELEPGVTVVVGPNGSGKSNVVDAIAWVLGAQAPSSVRSQKMDDVIFAGTAKRPALGRAEVALTIDNSAQMLDVEFSEVTVSRILFRSGDSEYAINGVPCRLLDVQELLSDAGVGRQQHVIVSQGQIDAVLNARPEDRRAIVEEAAGVLKFRKRKEKAQRRLDAMEANLLRVQDLIREVRRQLKPLERQAEAARRHEELVVELRALKLYVAGREIAGLRAALTKQAAARLEHTATERDLKAELARLDTEVVTLEAALSARGADDVSDRLMRVDHLRERARSLQAVIAERRRSIERDVGQLMDASLVASLEAEAAELRAGLEELDGNVSGVAGDLDELERDEERFAVERDSVLESLAEPTESSAASAAAEVRGELRSLRSALERAEREHRRGAERRHQLADRRQRLGTSLEQHRETSVAAIARQPGLDAARDAAAAAAESAETAVAEADAARQEAADAASRWSARVEALQLALDSAHARAGAEALAGTDGVLGTLLDLVEVDDGWEVAVEAALGEALQAVVVRDVATARRALEDLRANDTTGAVLALGASRVPSTSPIDAGDAVRPHVRGRDTGALASSVSTAGADPQSSSSGADAQASPAAGSPPSSSVAPSLSSAPSSTSSSSATSSSAPSPGSVASQQLDALLDGLLAGAVRVDTIAEAAEVAVAHPHAVVVTTSGDRYGPTGWRLGAAAAGGATAAALEEARAEADTAAARRDDAIAAVTAARRALAEAQTAARDATKAADGNASAAATAEEAIERETAQLVEIDAEMAGLVAALDEQETHLTTERERIAQFEEIIPRLDADEAAEAEAARLRGERRAELDARAALLTSRRRDLEVRSAGLTERKELLQGRLVDNERRLAANEAARAEAETRRGDLERSLRALGWLDELLLRRSGEIDAEHADLTERRRRQTDEVRELTAKLTTARQQRAETEQRLEAERERARRVELEEAETTMRLENAVEVLRRDLEVEPDVAEASPQPELPEGATAAGKVRELERELRLLGPINPLALEEFNELQQRHEFLSEQLDDVRTTRRELSKVISSIDHEIRTVFADAFADVSTNFTQLFQTLFPGGNGKLVLTQPDELLDTGIEVEAKPSGKNVKKLSLLSGGERSLTALAYLFAVFRSRPSPFYVMDEVEAALDDVNLQRFLSLVAEFRRDAQLLIVSHQKRTMEAGDCLLGVTMQPGGSSTVVTERVSA